MQLAFARSQLVGTSKIVAGARERRAKTRVVGEAGKLSREEITKLIIRSDEGLTLETSPSLSLHGGNCNVI